jgi:glycosyltransferase involved in cell wall biosynthesis
MADKNYNIGFLIEHVAGWVTHYGNLRKEAQNHLDLNPDWQEIVYYRPGGRLETLREQKLQFIPGYITGNLRFAYDFKQALDSQKYDAILTNSRIGGMLFPQQLARIPTVIDFDSTPRQFDRMPAYESPHDTPPIAYAKWRLHVRMYRSARMLQALSHWARRGIIEEYGVDGNKVVVNPPGVDLDFWRPTPEPTRSTHRRKKVLFVGGDFRRKGGYLLLEWFRQCAGRNIELHLVTKEPVQKGPNIFIYDNVGPNSAELRSLYQDADVFALPTLADCTPIVTIEAMASGLPVIMSDVGGFADMVEDGGNGFVVGSGNVSELTAALFAVLDDDARRLAMGRRSRNLAQERFDVERNASRTLGLLKDLAAGEAR